MLDVAYLQDVEVKFIDFENNDAVNLSGTYEFGAQDLTPITPGYGPSNRIGDNVYAQCLEINYEAIKDEMEISFDETYAAGIDGVLRVIVYQDTQSHGTPPIPQDIMQPNLGSNDMNCYAFYRDYNQQRFKILYDKTHRLATAYSTDMSPDPAAALYFSNKTLVPVSVKIPIPNTVLDFNPAGAVIRNRMGILFMSANDSTVSCRFFTRLYYTEMPIEY